MTQGLLVFFLTEKPNPLLDAAGARGGSLAADVQPQELDPSLLYQSVPATHYSQMCRFSPSDITISSLPSLSPCPLNKYSHCCVLETGDPRETHYMCPGQPGASFLWGTQGTQGKCPTHFSGRIVPLTFTVAV